MGDELHSRVSRTALLKELERLGINPAPLEPLTLSQLLDLVRGMNNLASFKEKKDKNKDKNNHPDAGSKITLSPLDKKILKSLLKFHGNVSSVTMAKDLNIPLTTLQRRRKRLASFIHHSCSLELKQLGLRSVTFFITSVSGTTSGIGMEILSWPGVLSVVRTFGSNGIDLTAEVLLKTNKEIVDYSERMKRLEGVKELFWTEWIEIMGMKNETYNSILDAA